jgi:hypothetical protein
MDTPDFLAIDFCAFLKPICSVIISVYPVRHSDEPAIQRPLTDQPVL